MAQDVPSGVAAVIEQAASARKVSSTEMLGVPREITDAVTQAGFQATTGTIAFAGRYATGEFAVQYNDQTGGYSSIWPQWAFELAKDALLGESECGLRPTAIPSGPTWSSS